DAHAADEAGFTIVGEAALLAALERHRTGRMGDIVATIQAEQDEAVRAPLPGILVVAGGPRTGKTAVAPHPAAHLLYPHRRPPAAGVPRGAARRAEPDLPPVHRRGAAVARGGRRPAHDGGGDQATAPGACGRGPRGRGAEGRRPHGAGDRAGVAGPGAARP